MDERGEGRSFEYSAPIDFRWTDHGEKSDRVPESEETQIVLARGYRLAGRITKGTEEGVILGSRVHGDRWIRMNRIREFVFAREVDLETEPRELDEDTAILRSGDRLRGALLWVTREGVHLHETKTAKDVFLPRSTVAALRLVAVERRTADPVPVMAVIETADGSSIRGDMPIVGEGRVKFHDLFGLEFDLPIEKVTRIRAGVEPENGSGSKSVLIDRPARQAPISGGGRYELVRTLDSLGGFAFHPDEKTFAHYSSRGAVELLSTQDWQILHAMPLKTDPSLTSTEVMRSSPAFTASGAEVYVQIGPKELTVLNTATGEAIRQIPLGYVSDGVAVLPFARGRALLNDDSRCMILLPEVKRSFELTRAAVGVADPDGTVIIGLCRSYDDSDGKSALLRYDPRTLKVKVILPMAERADLLAASSDGSRLFVAGREPPSIIRVHEAATLREVSRHRIQDGVLSALAVSPDGSWLAVATTKGGLRICRAGNVELEESVQLGSKPRSLAFSATGKFLGVRMDSVTHIFERK